MPSLTRPCRQNKPATTPFPVQEVRRELKRHGIVLDANAWTQIERYAALLIQWNRKINLISANSMQNVWTRHILDCLGLLCLPYFTPNSHWLDLGSGAGLPGLLLAMSRPELHVLSVEHRQKKASFQTHVLHTLALSNAEVMCADAKILVPNPLWRQRFDGVLARAFAPFQRLLPLARGFLKTGGVLVAFKGAQAKKEWEQTPATAWEPWFTFPIQCPHPCSLPTEPPNGSTLSDGSFWQFVRR